MPLDLMIAFDGDCKQAFDFYVRVFRAKVCSLMTYGETPPSYGYDVSESDNDRILYACIEIYGVAVMLMDVPSDVSLRKGDNICPTIALSSRNEIRRLFNELKAGGKVGMDLQKTFYSDLYGMVTDRFGVNWQLQHDNGAY
ncbi:MAG: VOC family protein [Clostridia bacterium]|nr:VOC family protein [Clostridia bacterium]